MLHQSLMDYLMPTFDMNNLNTVMISSIPISY